MGIIFFLSLACLSDVGAQSDLHSYSTKEDALFIQQEWDTSPFQERPVSSTEKSSSFIPPGRERLAVETLALPGHEESNDNFYMEFLVRDPRANEFDFDIPIVINARVEQFIECFQTTARERFVTWLGRSQKYIPLMKNLFRAHGLPEDLVYIALIESGFQRGGIQDHQRDETLSNSGLLETCGIPISETGDQKLCSPDDCSGAHCQRPEKIWIHRRRISGASSL